MRCNLDLELLWNRDESLCKELILTLVKAILSQKGKILTTISYNITDVLTD